jgi:hypothetical protein
MFAWWYQRQVELSVSRAPGSWCGYGDQVHLCTVTVSQPLPDFIEVSFLGLAKLLVPACSVRLRIPGQSSLYGRVMWTRGSLAGIALNTLPP